MKLSEADKMGMTPEEIRLLESESDAGGGETPAAGTESTTEGAATAAEGAEAADTTTDTTAAAAEGTDAAAEGTTEATTTTAAAAEGDGKPTATAEELQEVLDDGKKPELRLPTIEVQAVDFAEQRKTLNAQRREIEEKWTKGEISDDERVAQLDDVQSKIDDLLIKQAESSAIAKINDANAKANSKGFEDAVDAAVGVLVADEKNPIKYQADERAQKQFDTAFEMAAREPANAGKTPAELVRLAHNTVLALRGIAAAPPPQQSAQAAAPAAAPTRREVPPTLGGLPTAGRATESDDNFVKFSTLSGEASEIFLASLPKAEVDRLMRLADNMAAAR